MSPEVFLNLTEISPYSGVTNDTLTISNIDYVMHGYQYRVLFINPSYACDSLRISDEAILDIIKDSDEDDVPDEPDDLDDDNDGILDVVEDTVDTDGDGIPNHLDLDSDGDGCYDVIEAGFSDPDNDGILGTSPVTVDSLGKVIKNADGTDVIDGYTEPADLNQNGIKDYLEAGVLMSAWDSEVNIESSILGQSLIADPSSFDLSFNVVVQINVKDPEFYGAAFAKMKEETANLYNGSLELHEALAGQETGVTHFVVARAKSMADWITGRNNIFASDAFQNFSSSVRNISEVLDIHSARVVKQYNVN